MSDDEQPVPPAAPAEEAEHVDGGYRVALPTFEGPLDLLLHLIQQHELDIRDIPIGFITEKYVEYIKLMQELNIDVASEYLVMAATLAHIKSKMLLPTPPADQDDMDGLDDLDPRGELVRRLLEYQKYKHAAAELSDRSLLGRDVFARGAPAPSVDGPAPLAAISLFSLLDAFQAVLSRAKVTIDHEIDLERFSITDRINELVDVLRLRPSIPFEDLFTGVRSRGEMIVTFLALLEMTRLRITRLSQDAPLAPILIELSVAEDEAGELAAQADEEIGAPPPDVAPGEPDAATTTQDEHPDDDSDDGTSGTEHDG